MANELGGIVLGGVGLIKKIITHTYMYLNHYGMYKCRTFTKTRTDQVEYKGSATIYISSLLYMIYITGNVMGACAHFVFTSQATRTLCGV